MESKRIAIVSVGSRGDVQPYCVLGRALVARGHKVVVATEERLRSLVEDDFHLPFACIAGDSTGGLFDPKFQAGLAKGSLLSVMKMTKEWKSKFAISDILASYVKALEGAEVIVSGALCLPMSYGVAEKAKAAWVPLILQPTWPTMEFPIWVLAGLTLGLRCLNKWSYSVLFKRLWKEERQYINPWLEHTLDLPPITSSMGMIDVIGANERIPLLIASSAIFCGPHRAVPADYDLSKIHLHGPILAPPTPLPEAVTVFLRAARTAAAPVIYVGFGSMPTADPLALLYLVVDVCHRASCRAILAAGWSVLESPKATTLLEANAALLLVLPYVSHTALFPQVDCVVHHAGVGTSQAALASGTPQVPCPVLLDQPHNAKVLVGLGVAPKTIPFRHLSAKHLALAVQGVFRNVDNVQGKARDVGKSLQEEAAGALERYCGLITTVEPLHG
ncbi:hypothetical protein ACHHYP_10738 [Achlya hypogyna]|uniref:Uncharacterized protein n=1 Tax=Achlya hypogyna TaxID=1202772 RepID=A0A1V9ZHU5_ACHHY|nr:hypothetical protein ACHHYP_10738 [Achlya hypogyna]